MIGFAPGTENFTLMQKIVYCFVSQLIRLSDHFSERIKEERHFADQ